MRDCRAGRHFDRYHELASEYRKPLTETGYRLCRAAVMAFWAVGMLFCMASLLGLVDAILNK